MSISPSSCVAAVNPAQNNTSYLVQELIRMGRFEDAAFLVGSLTPTELNSLDYDGNNLLHQAAATGSLALVEAVMDGLNSPEEIATVGRLGSALWIAIDGGHEEVACAIAQRMRAEDLINIKKYNCTALDWAQGRGLAQLQVSIIRQLSTLTDTLPATCLLRYQLLDRAVWMQHRQVAKELIDSLESKVDTLTAPPVLEAGWTHRPRQPLSTSPIEA
ncbi:MAG: hypothetical protein KDK78_06020, partial [Chlamydiia bacterium]|nr:hypothetical protein [Chlamydiia bacterium]